MQFPGIGKMKKEKTADPSRAFGAQGQSEREILGDSYVAPSTPSALSKAGAVLSGWKNKAASLASQIHIPTRSDTPSEMPNPEEYYPPEAYPEQPYPQEPAYGPEGYAPPGYENMPPEQEPMPRNDGWYNPFTDPPSQDPRRQPAGVAYGYAPYGGYAPTYAPDLGYAPVPEYGYAPAPDYGYAPTPDQGYAPPEPPAAEAAGTAPSFEDYGPQEPFGEAYAPEGYPPQMPYGYDPYNSATGYYVGDDPYGNPMYVPFKPAQPAAAVRKPTDIRELKSTLWAVSIAAGVVLTLFSFVYACVV